MTTTIAVYPLANPAEIAPLADDIARILFDMPAAASGSRRFVVSPVSASLQFRDVEMLGTGKAVGAGSPNVDLVAAAVGWLSDASRRLSSFGAGNRQLLSSLIPLSVTPVETSSVTGSDGATVDHWLVRFAIRLPTAAPVITPSDAPLPSTQPQAAPLGATHQPSPPTRGTTEAPSPTTAVGPEPPPDAFVYGATIDIHLAAAGDIIGFLSTWRPVRGTQLVPRLPPPSRPSRDDGGSEDGGASGTEAPALIYLVAGEQEPQSYIAPYWAAATDEYLLVPASTYSLAISIVQEPTTEGTRLEAAVSGSTGPLNYVWGAWRIDQPWLGWTNLGEGKQAFVESGINDVHVDVTDTVTGASARAHAIVVAAAQPNPT